MFVVLAEAGLLCSAWYANALPITFGVKMLKGRIHICYRSFSMSSLATILCYQLAPHYVSKPWIHVMLGGAQYTCPGHFNIDVLYWH